MPKTNSNSTQSPVGASLLAMNDNAVCLMKNADKAAYDAWFKAQVQASLDDPRPSIPNDEAKRLMATKRDKLQKR